MLRAHRQAWAWQDEWVGLTIEDIRNLEKETQLILRRKLGRDVEEKEEEEEEEEEEVPQMAEEREKRRKSEEATAGGSATATVRTLERMSSLQRS